MYCMFPLDLREGVSTTEDSLSAVYGDGVMNSTVYHLHAVLVHQGQASGGHYWSYVRKPPSLHVERATPTTKATPTEAVVETTTTKLQKFSRNVSGSEMDSPTVPMESSSVGGEAGEGEGGGEQRVKSSGRRGEEESKSGGGGVVGGERGNVWLKFNDVSVHEVGWEEVMKESYGGHHNTSAYCLIYLSPLLHETWASSSES